MASALPAPLYPPRLVRVHTETPRADGSVVDSAVGLLSAQGAPVWLERVGRGAVKLEGLTARREQGPLQVWLISDADEPAVVAPLFTLSFRGPGRRGSPDR